MTSSKIAVHYYADDASTIVRTRTYGSASLAAAAIKRAQKRGQIAAYAGTRTASDPPTCHH